MKKTLSLLAVTLLGISGGQAAVTLVSGFSRFDQTSPDSGTAVSDLGTKSLSWTLNDALWNNDGTWTSNATNSKKNGLDVSSLQLSGAAGYTVNINFSSAASLDNTDSLFCASIGDVILQSYRSFFFALLISVRLVSQYLNFMIQHLPRTSH